ncbi:MAG: DNA polymerase III subunit gamma/tau [bacterium]
MTENNSTISLSRKYRPQNFSDLVNQKHVRVTLEQEIKNNRITHAYLFTGPRGVGKTTTARIFARQVNIDSKTKKPVEGWDFDLVELDAASHTQVDNVRENIIPNARTKPSRAKFKVFIIDEVHMLSLSAFNALLKIIEEPPDYIVFILVTTDVHRVPETIISRCQRFDFHRVEEGDLVVRLKKLADLEKIKISESVLINIAELADGSVRDAESFLGQIFSLGEKEVSEEVAGLVLPKRDRTRSLEYLNSLSQKDAKQAIESVNKAIEAGTTTQRFYADLILLTRQAIFQAIEKTKTNQDKRIVELAENNSLVWLSKVLRGLVELEPLFKSAYVPQLPLELFAVEIINPDQEAPLAKPSTPTTMPIKDPKPEPVGKTETETSSGKVENPESTTRVKSDNSLVNLDQLWSNLLIKAKESNHGLAVMLNACQPQAISGNQLRIQSKFAFHKDQINNMKNRKLLESLVSEIAGRVIKVECVLGNSQEVSAPASAESVEVKQAKTMQKPSKTEQGKDSNKSTWDKVLQAFG